MWMRPNPKPCRSAARGRNVPNELTHLDGREISLVRRPANRKRFCLLKSALPPLAQDVVTQCEELIAQLPREQQADARARLNRLLEDHDNG